MVTAQRREESLQDTPIAITAFTPDRIADLRDPQRHRHRRVRAEHLDREAAREQRQPWRSTSAASARQRVPWSTTRRWASTSTASTSSKAVGGVFDVVDLERVEVLRGPQGTLFGRNTTGGAVNITTKKPTGEFGLKANGTVGITTQRYGLRIDLPEYYNVAANLSVNHFQTDGWADNRYDGAGISSLQSDIEDTVASEDNWAYRLALRWRPLDSVTVDYAFDRTDNEGVPSPFQLTGVRTELFNGFTRRPFPSPPSAVPCTSKWPPRWAIRTIARRTSRSTTRPWSGPISTATR
ncbi:MAG: hypothetical protein IPF57_03895 [Gammaproteobacteria bacterium]|nr:hypothetical protein [Gammaproteobacteria bacterium]